MAQEAESAAPQVVGAGQRYRSLLGPAHTIERLELATEALRLAERSADHQSALTARVWRITELLELGETAAADAEIQLHARFADQHRQPGALWRAAVWRSMRAILHGRFEEAEWLAAQALEVGQRIEEPNAINVFGAQMLTLRREQGRLQELEDVNRNFLEQHPDHPGWRCALAFIYAESGREAEARSELERIYGDVLAAEPDLFWLLAMTTLSDVVAYLNDSIRAASLYELLRPYADRCVLVGHAAACLGSVSHYLGLLAHTCEQWEFAEQHFDNALRVNSNLGGTAILARTRHAYSNCILARGDAEPWRDRRMDHVRALDLLEGAIPTYFALGMASYRERAIAAKLRALKGTLPQKSAELARAATGADQTPDPLSGDDLPTGVATEVLFPVPRWNTYRALLKIRLGVCVALATVVPCGLFVAQQHRERWSPNTWPLLAIVAVATFLGIAYYAAAGRQRNAIAPSATSVYLVHWIDVLLATAAMAFLGGVDVLVGIPIYALILVHTAIEVPPRRVFALVAGASAAYTITILGMSVGSDLSQPIFVDIDHRAQADLVGQARVVLAVVNFLFLGVLAFLATTLTGLTRRQAARAQAAEAKVRRVNEQLEEKVNERTSALNAANRFLVAASVAQERTNHDNEIYARAVSHDIRSHITAAIEALGRNGAEVSSARMHRIAVDSLHGAERMLKGLHDLIQSRSPEPTISVATRPLLNEVIDEVRGVRDARNVQIVLVGSFFDIKAQPRKIRHAFRNLIDNAVAHTRDRPSGRVEIGQGTDGDSAVFWVRDNGEGISFEDQAAIFEPFRRGANSNRDGIGVGLALVRQIIEQHGGRVWVDSVLGKGATFWLKLPRFVDSRGDMEWKS